MIVDRIMARAAATALTRKPQRMSASSVGRCVRQCWYMEHDVAGEPLNARALLVFEIGDRVEDSVLHYIAQTDLEHLRTGGPGDTFTVPEVGFRGRPDLIFQCPTQDWSPDTELGIMAIAPSDLLPPEPGEVVGGEVKSMADFGFARAQRGEIDEGYRAQVECYMRALNIRWWLLVAYRKETSHLCEVWIGRDDNRWQAIKEAVSIARGAEIPARPYELDERCHGAKDGTCVDGKTPGRGQLHKRCGGTGKEPGGPFIPNFPCGYCGWKEPCWGSIEMVFREGKPAWRVQHG